MAVWQLPKNGRYMGTQNIKTNIDHKMVLSWGTSMF
jgi:hypothetical protein